MLLEREIVLCYVCECAFQRFYLVTSCVQGTQQEGRAVRGGGKALMLPILGYF